MGESGEQCFPSSLRQRPAPSLCSASLIFRRERNSNQILNVTKMWNFTAVTKGTSGSHWLPRLLAKGDLAEADQMRAEEGVMLCLQRRRPGFQTIREASGQ